MKRKSLVLAFAFFALVTFLLFSSFFLKGQAPFSGNFLQAWYEPWRTDNWNNGQLIPHKPIADDVFRQLFPFKGLAMEQVKQGNWPLWNPFNGAGMPLLATMHIGFLNPFNLFYLLFSPQLAWSLLVVIQPFLLGVSFFLFARHFGLSFKAAIFSSLGWVTSGFIVVRYIYADQLFALSAFPLILVLTDQIIKKGKSKLALLLPWLSFFVLGSGHPQGAFYVFFFSFLFALIIVLKEKKRKEALSGFFFWGLGVAAGFLLALPQLVLTADLWQKAVLNSFSSQFIFKKFLLPPYRLVTLAVPNFFGNPATYNFWGPADYVETVLYLGSGFFLLSLIGFFALKKINSSLRLLLLSMIVFAVLISFRNPIALLIAGLNIPFFSTSIPTRSFAFATFSLCFLGGLGFDHWFHKKNLPRKILGLILSSFLLIWLPIFLFVLINYRQGTNCPTPNILCWQVALRNSIFAFGVFCLTMLLLVFGQFFRRKQIASFLLLILILGSNLYLAKKFIPFTVNKDFYPSNEAIIILKEEQEKELFRFWSVGEGKIKTNLATALGLYNPDYYDPLYLKRYGKLINFANQGMVDDLKRSDVEIDDSLKESSLSQRKKLLELLSVKFILMKKVHFYDSEADSFKENFCESVFWENENWFICEQRKYLPYFLFFNDYEIIENEEEILTTLFDPDFDLNTKVILEMKPRLTGGGSEKTKIKLVNKKPGDYTFEIETEGQGLFYLNENFDSGWQAIVDGNRREIFRANYSFLALPIEASDHQVKFFYQPKFLKPAFYLSLFTGGLLVITSLIALGYKRYFGIRGKKK